MGRPKKDASEKKKNVMITLSPDVLKKARKAGFDNISEFTEKILRNATKALENKDNIPAKDRFIATHEFLKSTDSFLREMGFSFAVGSSETLITNTKGVKSTMPIIIFYVGNGKYFVQEFEVTTDLENLLKDREFYFYHISNIFENFIDELLKASERNRKSYAEIEVYKKIIDAMAGNILNKNHTHTKSENKRSSPINNKEVGRG